MAKLNDPILAEVRMVSGDGEWLATSSTTLSPSPTNDTPPTSGLYIKQNIYGI